MSFERLSEKIIEVDLVRLVDVRDGNCTTVADLAIICLASALNLDSGSCRGLCVCPLGFYPVLKGWVSRGKFCNP